MARPVLKLTKPVDPAATPRSMSSRAKRALRGVKGPKAVPAPAPVTATRAATAATTAEAQVPAATASAHGAARATGAAGAGSDAGTRRPRKRTQSGAAQRAGAEARKGAAPEVSEPGARRRRDAGGSQRVPAKPAPKEGFRRPHERRRGGGPPVDAPVRGASAAGRSSATAATTLSDGAIASRQQRDPDLPRLSKRMSELGVCSRREADDWIENGWVRVDGVVVNVLGTRVSPHATITVDKAATQYQAELVTILLHKPVGYVSGQAEDGYTPASVLITAENHWSDDPARKVFRPQHLRGLAPAGRLDIDSTGLLVFTQDGRIAKRLVGRDSEVEKEYLVRVTGTLSTEGLRKLQHGLELDGVKLRPAKVSWQNEDQLRFVLREGRKRQIRRMCELVGLEVAGLKRVRSGSVPLGALPVGQWRYLRPDESF